MTNPLWWLLGSVAASICVACFVLVRRASPAGAVRIARRLAWAIIGVSGAALLFGLSVSFGVIELGPVSRVVFRFFLFRFGIAAGCALATAGLLLSGFSDVTVRQSGRATSAFLDTGWILRALCISTAISFLAVEVGKLMHLGEMQEFFALAGYSTSFLYFIMGAETVGAVLLLANRQVVVASLWLAVLMIGAVHTHYRLGSAASDTFEAVHLLILLLPIAALAARNAGARRRVLLESNRPAAG